MRYRTYVHICVPGAAPVVYDGGVRQLTAAERDNAGEILAQSRSGSITLADGSELSLPTGIYQYAYFRIVPETERAP